MYQPFGWVHVAVPKGCGTLAFSNTSVHWTQKRTCYYWASVLSYKETTIGPYFLFFVIDPYKWEKISLSLVANLPLSSFPFPPPPTLCPTPPSLAPQTLPPFPAQPPLPRLNHHHVVAKSPLQLCSYRGKATSATLFMLPQSHLFNFVCAAHHHSWTNNENIILFKQYNIIIFLSLFF